MKFSETKDYIRGFAEYVTFMSGKELRCEWNKRLRQYEYWMKIRRSFTESPRDILLVSFEMADASNGVTCQFYSIGEYFVKFAEKIGIHRFNDDFFYGVANVFRKYLYIEDLKETLDTLYEVGYFDRS